MNLYTRFERAFGGATGVALRYPDGVWSYQRLSAETERMAAALIGLGLGPDDRVLAQVEKTPQAVALYLACLKIGAVYTPLNTACTDAEVRYFLDDLEPALFVAGAPAAVGRPVATLDAAGGGSLPALAARAPLGAATATRLDDDVAAIVYTSGTTGRSKGAMLTHGNLASNVETLCGCWGWRGDDVLLHALPLFHIHGLFVALHCAFSRATPVVLLPKFDAERVLRALPEASVMMGVPTFYARLLQEPALDAERCRGVRLFTSGSAPLAEQTWSEFQCRTGHRILERYGMSETLMNTSNPLDGDRRAGTVGFPLPGVDVRIADARGAPLPAGEVGGIEVRGPNVFKGYWRMPEQTREAFRDDGFFITGDLGAMADDGRVTIVGRAKDVVISGGCNVYPKEVETLLDQMPEVLESAVFGVPHPDFGEAVVAALICAKAVGQAQVDAFLRRRLARFKQPKAVLRVETLPRNTLGKVRKQALRERHATLFA